MMDRDLPPLQTLRAFETAARLLSMTQAAAELNVTHGAVSRQVKALEDYLGVPLFRRLTRRIVLTEAGLSLYATVSRQMAELRQETHRIRQGQDPNRLTISTNVSFAVKWLSPRLHRLMQRYPHYNIHLDVTDTNIDLTTGIADAAIRYGLGDYPKAQAERIMDETVTPVCSPGYAQALGGLSQPADLARCQLLHEDRMAANWHRWFTLTGAGSPPPRGPVFSHGSLTIEAAIRGEGVALGRSVLVGDDVAAGRLLALFPWSGLKTDRGYDLVFAPGHQNDPKVCALRDWMQAEIGTEDAFRMNETGSFEKNSILLNS